MGNIDNARKDKQVVVLSMGGTIASRHDAESGRTRILSSGQELIDSIPELGRIAQIRVDTVFTIPSFLIRPSDIEQLAHAAMAHLARQEVAGIVITHGTDTMEESSFLLDLLVDTQDKPIVFTGAQLSADMQGSDGPRNLVNAVRLAASDAARGLGVVVAFADSIFAARDVTKAHTSRLEPFVSTRGCKLGEISRDDIRIYGPANKSPTYDVSSLTAQVGLVHLSMGADDVGYLRFCLEQGMRGLVIQSFGIGNANPEIVELVTQAVGGDVPVVITSRCGAGRVTPVYGHGGGQDLYDAGAIFAGDLAGEKARLALIVLLAGRHDMESIRKEMLRIAA